MITAKKQPSKIQSFQKKMLKPIKKLSSRSSSHAIHFLNVAQLLGALNDNVFKFLTIYLLIDITDSSKSSEILFWIGAVYVLPFILFSSFGGNLADKFSKQKLVVYLKLLEVIVMALGIPAFYFKSPVACYTVVFLMSLQSALFGPPKYSIIADLVPEEKLSKANGLITSSTYLAIIFGSFLASFITQITGKNFVAGAIACTTIALIGYIASLGLPKLSHQNAKKKMNPLVFQEIYRTLSFCKKSPIFLLAVLGSSVFLFIGAFIQLNIIPYAINTLGLSEVAGGYLFVTCSIGIALGSYIAGKSSKGTINLGLSSLASLMITVIFILLPIFSFSIACTVGCLVLLGFVGGLYVIPLDTYIQTYAPKEKRGEIIACVNFLSFCGVLMAPILLYLFSGVLKLSNGIGFTMVGVLNLIIFILMVRKLSAVFLYSFVKKLIRPFFSVKQFPAHIDFKKSNGLVLQYKKFFSFLLIFGLSPKIHLWVVGKSRPWYAKLLKIFKNIHFLDADHSALIPLLTYKNTVEALHDKAYLPCLVLLPSFYKAFENSIEMRVGMEKLKKCCDFLSIDTQHHFKRSFKKPWKLKEASFRLIETT
jgi:acyl-[acyl-carrier-protein]-phospholipid O-acyltransferase/long-chain-fatty-acid--[acyl-carrier-protein] ligase